MFLLHRGNSPCEKKKGENHGDLLISNIMTLTPNNIISCSKIDAIQEKK